MTERQKPAFDIPSLRHRAKLSFFPLAPRDLRSEEALARRRLRRRLAEERQLSLAVYNSTRPVIDNTSMTAKVAEWAYTSGMDAQRILGVRIVRDFRCVVEDLFSGYMVQAATVASGLYEAALTVRYIGHDKQRQRQWFQHKDPIHLPRVLGHMVNKLHPNHPSMQDWYNETYKHLCMLKHGNPLRRDAAFDDPRIFDDEVRVNAGPNAARRDDIERRFILAASSYHTLRAFQIIATTFQKYHALKVNWGEHIGDILHRLLHYIEDRFNFRVTH